MNTCVLRMNTAPGQRWGTVQAPACGKLRNRAKIRRLFWMAHKLQPGHGHETSDDCHC